jgi:hypothetical protein
VDTQSTIDSKGEVTMVETVNPLDVAALPLAPRSPLPYRQRLWATRNYNTGAEFRSPDGISALGGSCPQWP